MTERGDRERKRAGETRERVREIEREIERDIESDMIEREREGREGGISAPSLIH